jgi:ribosomal protein S18 acetylase RimI-like enzyme
LIRPTAAEDHPHLGSVIEAVELFPSDMLAGMLAPYLSGHGTQDQWLTCEEGAPLGVAYFVPERLTDRTRNLLLIAVHPDHQGKGHGAALLRSVEAALSRLDGRMLLIETSGLAGFAAQRGLYRKCGHEEEARIRDFYQAGDDKVVFRKVLG